MLPIPASITGRSLSQPKIGARQKKAPSFAAIVVNAVLMDVDIGELDLQADLSAEELLVLTANNNLLAGAMAGQSGNGTPGGDHYPMSALSSFGLERESFQDCSADHSQEAPDGIRGSFSSLSVPSGFACETQSPAGSERLLGRPFSRATPSGGFLAERCFGAENLTRILQLWSRPPVFTSFWLLAKMVGYGGTNPSEAVRAILTHQGWSPDVSLRGRMEVFGKFTKERVVDIGIMLNVQHRRGTNAATLLSLVLKVADGADSSTVGRLCVTEDALLTANAERVQILHRGASEERRGFTEDAFIRPPFTAISWLAPHPHPSELPPRWTPRRLRSSRFCIRNGVLVPIDRYGTSGEVEEGRSETSQLNGAHLHRIHETMAAVQHVQSTGITQEMPMNPLERTLANSQAPGVMRNPRGTANQADSFSRLWTDDVMALALEAQNARSGCDESIQSFLSLVDNISFDTRQNDFTTDRTFCKKLTRGLPTSLEFSVPVPLDKMLPKMPSLRTAIVLRCFEVSNRRISSWDCAFPASCRAWLSLQSSSSSQLHSVDIKKAAQYVDLTLPIQKAYRKEVQLGTGGRTLLLRLDINQSLEEHVCPWPAEKFYVFVVQSAHLFSVEFELERVLARKRPSAEKARAILCPAVQAGDDDLDIESVRISLLCPLSRTRIKIPVRVRGSTQLQCFDAISYIEMSRLTKRFICPVTNKPAPLHMLQVCEFFRKALEFAHPEEEFIDVLPDGTFMHTMAAESEPSALRASMKCERAISFEPFSERKSQTLQNNSSWHDRTENSGCLADTIVVDLCD